jgi:hypothetical protein
MREQAMQKAGLYNSPSRIWQLQREAHAKQQDAAVKEVQTNTEEVKTESESISARYELISRLDASHELLKQYQRVLSSMSKALDDLQTLSETETGGRRPVVQLIDLVRQSQDKPLRMSEFESSQTKLVKKYRDLEQEAQVAYAKYLEELGLKQTNLEGSLNRLQSSVRRQRDRIRLMESSEAALHMADQADSEEVAKLRVRLQTDKQNYEERLQRLRDEHRASREALIEDSRRSVRKEMEESSKDKDLAVEEAQRLEIELEQFRAQANSEISELQNTYKREIELLSASLREESQYRSQDHQAQLDDLKRAHRSRENELLGKLERLTSEEHSAVADLREKLSEAHVRQEDLHMVLRAIGESLHSVYVKHAATHKDWDFDLSRRKQELLERLREETWCVDEVMEAEFVCYLVAKLNADNDWLVERLAEFGKENDRLRRSGSPNGKSESFNKQVREDIHATSAALKGFESARDRLMQQFRSSQGEGGTWREESPDIVSALYKKYIGSPDK